jgi:hypothetical protein
MSTYDIVRATYDIVRLFEGVAPAVFYYPGPQPKARAYGLCLSYSQRLIFGLATSETWC